MNNLENFHPQEKWGFIVQSRETLLRLGYSYVVFKSKVKKRLAKLKN